MRLLFVIGCIIMLLGKAEAQIAIPFKFTSDDDNKLVRENDTVKFYRATDDTANIVSINEESSYYRLLSPGKKVLAEGSFVTEGEQMLQEGRWLQYYGSGKVMVSGYYRKGKLIGTWNEYYTSGRLKKVSNYGAMTDKDGLNTCLAGTYQEFYDNGKLKVNGFYAAERRKIADTVEVEDPVSGTKTRKILSTSAYKPQKTGAWEYYTEDGELDKKEEH